jgi:hypothetical protein
MGRPAADDHHLTHLQCYALLLCSCDLSQRCVPALTLVVPSVPVLSWHLKTSTVWSSPAAQRWALFSKAPRAPANMQYASACPRQPHKPINIVHVSSQILYLTLVAVYVQRDRPRHIELVIVRLPPLVPAPAIESIRLELVTLPLCKHQL